MTLPLKSTISEKNLATVQRQKESLHLVIGQNIFKQEVFEVGMQAVVRASHF